MGFIGFTPGICMVVSGLRGSVMGVEFIVVKMGASIVGILKAELNMELVTTISGKTRFNVSHFPVLNFLNVCYMCICLVILI